MCVSVMQVFAVSCAWFVPCGGAMRGVVMAVCQGGGLLSQSHRSLCQDPHEDPRRLQLHAAVPSRVAVQHK